jgi:iron complex transport system substrate-binding protein
MRIVSICPSNTEILYDMGMGEWLVGLDDDSDWPPELQHLPRVGRDLNIDIDKVAALKPDLVVASLSVPGMEKNIETLDRAKIPYIVLNPSHIEEIPDDYLIVGKATGTPDKATAAAARFRKRLTDLTAKGAQIKASPTLYWEWWPNPIYTPGRQNWLSDLSRMAGGVNLFDHYDTDNVKTDHATVAQLDPDYVFAVWCGVPFDKVKKSKITNRPGWSEMKAVKNDRVYIFEEGLYCRPSFRLLDGLEQLIDVISRE